MAARARPRPRWWPGACWRSSCSRRCSPRGSPRTTRPRDRSALRLAPVGAPGHVLGTDEQGRDMLSRLLWGGRMTLVAGLTPVAGGLRARHRRWACWPATSAGSPTRSSMRTMDIFYAFPAVLLAIAISGALGPGLPNTLISLSIVFIAARGAGGRVRHRAGEGPASTSRRRGPAAPACGADRAPPSAGQRARPDPGVRQHPGVALASSWPPACRFLGLGVTPPAAGVGADAEHAAPVDLRERAGSPALPGLAIFVTSMAFNLLSDGLRDAWRSAR